MLHKPNSLNTQLFFFDGAGVLAFEKKGEIWFFAKEVCEALGYKNLTRALMKLESDEKGVTIRSTLGGPQEVNIISEAGLYRLVFSSQLESAKRFTRWVTHDVIPALRETGEYGTPLSFRRRRINQQAWAKAQSNAAEVFEFVRA